MLLTYILTCFQLAAPDRVASLSFADRWMLMKEVSQKEVFQETHDQTFAFHMMMCHTVRPLVAMKDSDESDGWAFRSGNPTGELPPGSTWTADSTCISGGTPGLSQTSGSPYYVVLPSSEDIG